MCWFVFYRVSTKVCRQCMWALCGVCERSPGIGKADLLDPRAKFSHSRRNLQLVWVWMSSKEETSTSLTGSFLLCLVPFEWGSVGHTTVSRWDVLLRELYCSALHEHLQGCNSLQGSSCSLHGTQWSAWLGMSCLEHSGDSSFGISRWS